MIKLVCGGPNGHEYSFSCLTTQSYFYTHDVNQEAEDAVDELFQAIDHMCEAAEDWEYRGPDEHREVIGRLAASGRKVLECISTPEELPNLRTILMGSSVVAPAPGNTIPWEFVYLGQNPDEPNLGDFLGARATVARSFIDPTGRSIARPINQSGPLVSASEFFGMPQGATLEVSIAQDNRLSSAQSKEEISIFEQAKAQVSELQQLELTRKPASKEAFREFMEQSEWLTHFNCHADKASGLNPDKRGKMYVSNAYPIAVDELKDLHIAPASIVVLNVCYGALLQLHAKSTLATAFARKPVAAVVTTFNRVPDRFATAWASSFYEALLAGRSIRESLTAAKEQIIKQANNPAVLLYTIIGDYQSRLPNLEK